MNIGMISLNWFATTQQCKPILAFLDKRLSILQELLSLPIPHHRLESSPLSERNESTLLLLWLLVLLGYCRQRAFLFALELIVKLVKLRRLCRWRSSGRSVGKRPSYRHQYSLVHRLQYARILCPDQTPHDLAMVPIQFLERMWVWLQLGLDQLSSLFELGPEFGRT